MRILLLIHGFNSLSQRMFVELQDAGHEVTIEFDINDDLTRQAVELFEPDVLVAPYLKRAIPDDIWQNHLCLIVHPGVIGDRGPSALDWAILRGDGAWGVTLLQAEAEMDAGPIWASREFKMRDGAKSSIYRDEVAGGAISAVLEALGKIATGERPRPLNYEDEDVHGELQPAVLQKHRAIDWQVDSTAQILGKIHASDGVPGVRDEGVYLHDVHLANGIKGPVGEILATSGPAICRGTIDGALWIGHMRDPEANHSFKLPATKVLAEKIGNVPEIELDSELGYQEISYHEVGYVGFLRFNFYNGAMSTQQCNRLRVAYIKASARPTKTIILEGGDDFWSNGIHLNIIESASSAADESWNNINAMDDLSEVIIRTTTHLTIAALGGNAGAGGVFLARACDHVWQRKGVILNPHYKDMGNLYGSEFWTYLLPRFCGTENAKRIAEQRLPMGAKEAVKLGLVDACFGETRSEFAAEVLRRAKQISSSGFALALKDKQSRRDTDEAHKPLSQYRREELARMRRNFYGFDPSYHIARYNFVHKICKSRTPITLARHRDKRSDIAERKAS